jgi:hypothetical protein
VKNSQCLLIIVSVTLAPHLPWWMAIPLVLVWCFIAYCAVKAGE